MILGDIKLEALRIMFVDFNVNYSVDEIPMLALDEKYGSFLMNMNGAINRCFAIIENRRILPTCTHRLQEGGRVEGAYTRFDLGPDFIDIDRLICVKDDEYCGDCDYRLEGSTIVIKNFDKKNNYRVSYFPKLLRFDSKLAEMAAIENVSLDKFDLSDYVPDNIAEFIPYFIKGDLYRVEEPNEASEARNWFEGALDSIYSAKYGKTNTVETIYSQSEY